MQYSQLSTDSDRTQTLLITIGENPSESVAANHIAQEAFPVQWNDRSGAFEGVCGSRDNLFRNECADDL
jgi:hypothetical protein